MNMLRTALSLLLVLVFGLAAQAQAIRKLAVDWAVPESPAFTVLGVTPDTVTRPSSVQQLASSILNGVDKNGNFQSGVALDVQPYLLGYGYKVDFNTYKTNYLVRFLSRLQTSIGTTKGASDADKSTRIALGTRISVFDLGDPYRDDETAKCLSLAGEAALKKAGEAPPPKATDEVKKAYTDKLTTLGREEERTCRTAQESSYRLSRWNQSSMIMGVAPSWISPTGTTSNMKWDGGGFWTSAGYGFETVPGLEDNAQLIFHYRYRNQEQIPDPDNEGSFLRQNSSVAGARFRFGNANATGSFEYVFMRLDVAGKPRDQASRLSVGLERRLAENIWLGLSYGTERGRNDGANKAYVLSSFNWSFNHKED